jgi:hypothetical protein
MRKTIIAGLLLLVSFEGFSQTNYLPFNADNSDFFVSTEKEQLKYLDSLYVVETGYVNNFINGRDYIQYYFRSDHKPILHYDRERSASLTYKGRAYDNLVLQYDTYFDKVIYSDNSMVYNDIVRQVALNSANINRFILYFDNDTLNFRYFSDEFDPAFNLEDGFYEVVYDGTCKYLVRHKSTKYKFQGVDEYSYKPSGYVRVGDVFVRITSRKQFVNLFSGKSKEINRIISEKRIKIRMADKHQIADILRFYESIETGSR